MCTVRFTSGLVHDLMVCLRCPTQIQIINGFRIYCVEMFTLHRDKYQHRFPLGFVPVLVSVSVTVSVNTFIHVNTSVHWIGLYCNEFHKVHLFLYERLVLRVTVPLMSRRRTTRCSCRTTSVTEAIPTWRSTAGTSSKPGSPSSTCAARRVTTSVPSTS